MRERARTKPDLATTSINHIDAIANGKEYLGSWQYNVADHFKDKTGDEIRQTLKDTAHPFAVAMENWLGDFNFGTLIRNANAFNAREVFYIGNKRYDRRGAQGTYHYSPVKWLSTIDEFVSLKEQYRIVGVDNINDAIPISKYKHLPNSLYVFGEEGVGLTTAMQDLCENIIEIEMFGSVRSLNCGVASGIIMHDFVSKYRG
jgi:tRNA G18 (ribose-2'-O)-methylase SpoU